MYCRSYAGFEAGPWLDGALYPGAMVWAVRQANLGTVNVGISDRKSSLLAVGHDQKHNCLRQNVDLSGRICNF